MTFLPSTTRCHHHPDREGVGICVSCRTVVCVECSTRVDRMNYCIRCLRSAADPGSGRVENAHLERLLGLPLLVLAFLGAAGVFMGFGLLLATLRSWFPGGITAG